MKPAMLDKLIWTLIYGGMIAVALGVSVQRRDGAIGWALVIAGVALSTVGAACVVVRSRMKDSPD